MTERLSLTHSLTHSLTIDKETEIREARELAQSHTAKRGAGIQPFITHPRWSDCISQCFLPWQMEAERLREPGKRHQN